MDIEIIKWIAGVLVVPSIVFGFIVCSLLRDIKRGTDKLLEMHHNADKYGFGTVSLGEFLREMRDSFKDQNYYMKWMVEEMVGKKPPPPVHNIDT